MISTAKRYKNDRYDRFWGTYNKDGWKIQTTNQSVTPNIREQPSDVMETQSVPMNDQSLEIKLTLDITFKYHLIRHFVELESLKSNQSRSLIVTTNDIYYTKINSEKLNYLKAYSLYTPNPITSSQELNLSIVKANDSTLPPIINAIEVYIVRELTEQPTHDGDGKELIKPYNVL
jgi:hypothetical protein